MTSDAHTARRPQSAARNIPKITGTTNTTKLSRPPSRPSKFTPEIAWRLVGLIVSGHSIVDAAAEVGVSARSVERWRARAWSRAPEDEAYVAIEKAIVRGRLAAAEIGQPAQLRKLTPARVSLDDLLREFV